MMCLKMCRKKDVRALVREYRTHHAEWKARRKRMISRNERFLWDGFLRRMGWPGLTDTASATQILKSPENSAFCASRGAECVANCASNPGGF